MEFTIPLKEALNTVSKPFTFSAHLGYRGVKAIVYHSQPRNKWVLGVCVVGGVWAHRMAEVYAPQILADLVVAHTVTQIKYRFIGVWFGRLVVAPGIVPTLVPIAAYMVAAVVAYALVLGGNGFCYLISGSSSQSKD